MDLLILLFLVLGFTLPTVYAFISLRNNNHKLSKSEIENIALSNAMGYQQLKI